MGINGGAGSREASAHLPEVLLVSGHSFAYSTYTLETRERRDVGVDNLYLEISFGTGASLSWSGLNG